MINNGFLNLPSAGIAFGLFHFHHVARLDDADDKVSETRIHQQQRTIVIHDKSFQNQRIDHIEIFGIHQSILREIKKYILLFLREQRPY